MAKRVSRVILDTNLWISFLISKDWSWLDEKILTGSVILIFSPESLEEFITVVSRPKFKHLFSSDDVEALTEVFDSFGEFVTVTSKVNACRDAKDNFLLALAEDGEADYIVTGDHDLIDLKVFGKTDIISLRQFREKLL
jgi:putative PIN family toxin of toxin-antitoxin system